MKILCLSFILLICFSCTPKLDKLDLNGTWQFLASNEVGEKELFSGTSIEWDTIMVPGNWDTRERYKEYVGKGYYKRIFDTPANWKGSQIRLKFDAVYETAKVWLNGKLLGEHVGGYTPFEFVVTDQINYGKENVLLVMADNTYRRGAWWAWGGISRDVALFRDNEVRIVSQHISAIPDFENQSVNFHIKYKIENNSSSTKNIQIVSEIIDVSESLKNASSELEVAANSVNEHQISFTEPLTKFKFWHFNHPNLYKLQTELKQKENTIGSKTDQFGIRKLEAIGEQLYLNNEVVYMNGFNRVHDHPDFGNTEPDNLVQKDILDMKSLGGVFSRMMHAPLAENLLDFCDSVGYMVIEEIPVWGDDDPQIFENNPLTKQWLKEMIERDFNHPCVVGWSVGNELRDTAGVWAEKTLTPDQYKYINSMLDYVAELDSTRLKTYVSLSAYLKNADMSNEPFDKLDLICINSYNDGVKAAENTHAKFPGKPIFLSEIGIAQIGPAPDGALSERLVEQLVGLKSLPYVVGSALWSYNDYRSNYKGTPESGFREWGVVDEQRQPKKAYRQIKEIYGGKNE